MRINKSINLVLFWLFLLTGCNNRQEKILFDFLNNNEELFDDKSYKVVSIELKDTVYESEMDQFQYWDEFNTETDDEVSVDTTAYTGDSEVISYGPDIDKLKNGSYETSLYTYLTFYSSYTYSDNSQNEFLNNIKAINIIEFEKKIQEDVTFRQNLIKEMQGYDFKDIYNPDSINKYLAIERIKTKTIYGFIYNFKYRIKDELFYKKLLFNKSQDKILKSINVESR